MTVSGNKEKNISPVYFVFWTLPPRTFPSFFSLFFSSFYFFPIFFLFLQPRKLFFIPLLRTIKETKKQRPTCSQRNVQRGSFLGRTKLPIPHRTPNVLIRKKTNEGVEGFSPQIEKYHLSNLFNLRCPIDRPRYWCVVVRCWGIIIATNREQK